MTPGSDDKSFNINFKIVKDQFPSYLEFLVAGTLNEVELAAYQGGYLTYRVLDNGLLEWRLTGKRYNG